MAHETVLIIDDEQLIRRSIAKRLSLSGYEVLEAEDGRTAIEKAGHSVQQAEGRKAVQEALNKGAFDLVVLGPTLSRNDRHHLPYMVKKANAATNVLVMHADGSRHPYVDACTDTGSSLEHVLGKIESMKIAGTAPAAAGAAAGR